MLSDADLAVWGLAPKPEPKPRAMREYELVHPPVVTAYIYESVWVTVAIYTTQVVVNPKQAAHEPISGKAAIFSRTATTIEEKLGVEVLAVCETREEAQKVADEHRAGHPHLAVEYQVVTRPIGAPKPPETTESVAAKQYCLDCGVETHKETRCPKCRDAFWAKSREEFRQIVEAEGE